MSFWGKGSYLKDKFVGVYEPDAGTRTREQPPTLGQSLGIDVTPEWAPAPGTLGFWGSLALAGVGLGAHRATAPIRGAMTWVRHPVAKYFAVYRSSTTLGRGSKLYLQASKGLRYANYVAFAMNPLATYHYMKNGEYDKAMVQYFGPIGSVWVYTKLRPEPQGIKELQAGGPQARTRLREDTRTRRPGKMPEKQRMRLWRMGLRWCKQHKRYDRCSLRARR